MNKKILILANLDIGLYKFRKALIKELIDQGNEVYISLPKGMLVQNLKRNGMPFYRNTGRSQRNQSSNRS